MPHCLQYSWNSFEVYSPPLSDLSVFILQPLSTSTRALKFLKVVNAADFSLIKNTQSFLLKSSIKVMMYLLPPREGVYNGPQISVWTNCNGAFALHDFPTGNEFLCCLPRVHASHTCLGFSIVGKPCTMFAVDNSLGPLKWRCPYLRCHFHDSLFISPWKHFSSLVLRYSGTCNSSPFGLELYASHVHLSMTKRDSPCVLHTPSLRVTQD